MNSTRLRWSGLLLLGALAALGWWLARSPQPAGEVPAASTDVLYWYDPMRPEVHFDKPGPSPFMDMALVPKYRAQDDTGGISISPRVSQNLGVRTKSAMLASITPAVTVTGTVTVDERRQSVVAVRAAGWIESLDVRATGDPVRPGQRIAGLYSPDLLAAQEEYLLAIRSNDQALIPAALRRLELLGMTPRQLERIASGGRAEREVDIVAPAGGVVTGLLVRTGAAVNSGMPIINMADLSQVWIIAEVPESEGSWLQAGQAAAVTLAAANAGLIEGRVDYVYPEVAPVTRTLRARIVVANADAMLRPGMAARVTLRGEPRQALLVPASAVIRSGDRTVVILAEGKGLFRPVLVRTGAEQAEQVEITAGLTAGAPVVVSGQFLLDSEANLRGALDRLLPGDQQ
jgi:Cu(I)/Ag(I) efflux system membrane fusion protein